MKYYVLGIYGDVEPMVSEQFDNKEDRDKEALQWKRDNTTDDGGIYRLDVDDNGIPNVESYGYLELNPEENIHYPDILTDEDIKNEINKIENE